MIYDKLIAQYKNLTEEEQNALLVYKSRLGRAINALDNNEQEIATIYQQYKALVESPQNLFIKLTVFKNIAFDNLNSFKESLRQTLQIIENATYKIILPSPQTVYRVVSVPAQDQVALLSQGNLISTSLDITECEKFLVSDFNKNYHHYLYKIILEPSSPLGICPYAILYDTLNERLLLTQKQDQKELILSKDDYDFEQIDYQEKVLENQETLSIITFQAHLKELEISPHNL